MINCGLCFSSKKKKKGLGSFFFFFSLYILLISALFISIISSVPVLKFDYFLFRNTKRDKKGVKTAARGQVSDSSLLSEIYFIDLCLKAWGGGNTKSIKLLMISGTKWGIQITVHDSYFTLIALTFTHYLSFYFSSHFIECQLRHQKVKISLHFLKACLIHKTVQNQRSVSLHYAFHTFESKKH